MNENQLTVATVVQPEPTVESLIRAAVEHAVPVETMERLLAMRRELRAEAAKESYDRAMAAFQAECPIIQKTKEVRTRAGKLAYRYAPIESIVEQVKHLLQKHGFSYTTGMELVEGGVKVVVQVKHCAGHSESSHMHVPFGTKTDIMSDSQVVAAAQTFAKRYAFCNAFGILTGDEDNDARTADPPGPPSSQPPPNKVAPAPSQAPRNGDKPLPERIANLTTALGGKASWAVGYLRNYTVEGSDASAALLPNEDLKGLSRPQIEYLHDHWAEFLARLNDYIKENASEPPPFGYDEADMEAAKQEALDDSIEPPGGWQGAAHAPPDTEWFWDVVVPIPYKGMKRDFYMQNPDTIRSLYAARHGKDEDSNIKRQRLWGFVNHYQPEGFKGRPPSEGDVRFRKALDALADYMEKKNEKL